MVSELSPQAPWPGLRAFRESDQTFFFGRQRETRELVDLVQRAPVAVFYGRSGLGKTSLIGAGLFPELRRLDYIAVLVRLDHNLEAPPLADQVKAALIAELDAQHVAGPRPGRGESLWEYFHRRDLDLWARGNRLVTAVIVLDQFEEIFTLGQRTDASSRRAAAFVAELESVVEHRPPDNVRQDLEERPEDALRYDLQREGVKLVLSLREDFLAQLDTWRTRMPSLVPHRFRLERLTGAQALDVVECAGRELVDPAIAREIVEFVSASQRTPQERRLEERPVEPALLSVVCDELNRRRIERGQQRISRDLLTHEREEIIQAFYTRSFDGIHPALREWVEDELLTASGFREQAAEEDALKLGVPPGDIDRLIDRRILQREERGGVIRLELTHDLLTDPANRSRNDRERRHQTEVAAAREAQIARELYRTRRLAAIFGVVLIAMAGTAVWAFIAGGQAARARDAADLALRTAERSEKQASAERDKARESEEVANNERDNAQRSAEDAKASAARAEAAFETALETVKSFDRRVLDLVRGKLGASTATIQEIVQAGDDAYAELLNQNPASPDLSARYASFLARAAETLYLVGHVRQGRALGERSVNLIRGPRASHASPDVRLTAGQAYLSHGKGLLAVGRYPEARRNLEAALKEVNDLLKSARGAEAAEVVIGAQVGLGKLELARADRQPAARHFASVVSFLSANRLPEPYANDVSAWRVEALQGQALSAPDDTQSAQRYAEADREVATLLRQDGQNPRWQRLAAELSYVRGFSQLRAGNFEAAEEHFTRSGQLSRGLEALDGKNRDWQYLAVLSDRGWTELHVARQTWQIADRILAEPGPEPSPKQPPKNDSSVTRSALVRLHALREQEPEWVSVNYLYGALLWYRGDLCLQWNRILEAPGRPRRDPKDERCRDQQASSELRLFKAAQAVMEREARRVPEHAELRRSVALTLGSQGTALAGSKNYDQALVHYAEAIRQLRVSPRLAALSEFHSNEANYLYLSGDALLKLGRRDEAIRSLEQAVAIFNGIQKRTATPSRYVDLSSVHIALGEAHTEPKSAGGARVLQEYGLAESAVRLALAVRPTDPALLHQLSFIQGRVSQLYFERGEIARAVAGLEETMGTLWPPLCANAANSGLNTNLTIYRQWVDKWNAAVLPLDKAAVELKSRLTTLKEKTEESKLIDCGRREAMSLPPLMPGSWRTLLQPEQAEKLAEWNHRDERLRPGRVLLMRRRDLPFYNDAALYEVEVEVQKNRRGILSVVQRGREVVVLNGISNVIHDMNRAAPPLLDTVEQATAYLQFFVGSISAESGRFVLFERASDLHWAANATADQKATVAKGISPLTVWQDWTGQWQAVGSMHHGSAAFWTTLLLDRSGMVEMKGDTVFAVNLPLDLEIFVDGARVLELPEEKRRREESPEEKLRRERQARLDEILTRLKTNPNDAQSLEALPVRYADLKRWPEAVAAQDRWIATIRRTIRDADALRRELQGEFLTLSWYQLLARDFKGALASTDAGRALDPAYLPLDTNRAHALLFLGRTAEAEALYLEHLGKSMKPFSENTWAREVLNDFDVLGSDGLTHPEWARIRKLLGDAPAAR